MEDGTPIKYHIKPAGFWIRVVASLIDGSVFIPIGILAFLNLLLIKSIFLSFLIAIPGLIYKPYMESFYGATLGKMACGIRVVDDQNQRLTLSDAYIRFSPFLLSSIITLIETLMIYSSPEFKSASNFTEISRLFGGNPLNAISTMLGYFILIDCGVVIFTHRKRALHDMMAGSFCIRKQREK